MSRTDDRDVTEQRLHRLVVDSRTGDMQAYQSLLRELYPVMQKYAYAQLGRFGRQHMAEDIVQDAILSIHLKLHTYDDALPFLAWVRSILKYRLIDTLRRQKVQNFSFDDKIFDSLADGSAAADPESACHARDLLGLLSQLKPPTGEIIHALKIEGASIKELAARYHMTESNVKVLVHRGLRKLADGIAIKGG
jgi:RNA polymerase sigma-70 factor (ECF subfamily)